MSQSICCVLVRSQPQHPFRSTSTRVHLPRDLSTSSCSSTQSISVSQSPNMKVVVAGASGGIGQVWLELNRLPDRDVAHRCSQPLSLLLKSCPLVDNLSLYDVVNTPGVAADLSHISSPAVSDH